VDLVFFSETPCNSLHYYTEFHGEIKEEVDGEKNRGKMKFFGQVLLTIVVCFILQFLLPWWTLAIGAFGVGYLVNNKPFLSFLAGFLGGAILWAGVSYYSMVVTHEILSSKVDQLLPAPALYLSAAIGALVAAFAAMTGSLLRSFVGARERRAF
jgi:hypothetical protein